MKISILLAPLALAIVVGASVAQSNHHLKQAPKAGEGVDAKLKEGLKDPSRLNEKAPATFKVKFVTSQGEVIVDVTRAWSPLGADRFYNLVKHGFFEGVRFFRVVPDFVVQFGISGDPSIASKWNQATIDDEPVKESNKTGYLVFAKTNRPNTRSCQLFINLKDNAFLDQMGFSPFAKVSRGMDVVLKLYSGYGGTPSDHQAEIVAGGNEYLKQNFPKLDYIKTATILK